MLRKILKSVLVLSLLTTATLAFAFDDCPSAANAQKIFANSVSKLTAVATPPSGWYQYQATGGDQITIDYYTQKIPSDNLVNHVWALSTFIDGAPLSVDVPASGSVPAMRHCYYPDTSGELDANGLPEIPTDPIPVLANKAQVLALEYGAGVHPTPGELQVAVTFVFPTSVSAPETVDWVKLVGSAGTYQKAPANTPTDIISGIPGSVTPISYTYSASDETVNSTKYCATPGTVMVGNTQPNSITVTYSTDACSAPTPKTTDVDVTFTFTGVTPPSTTIVGSVGLTNPTTGQSYSVANASVGGAKITGVATSDAGVIYNYSASDVMLGTQNYCAVAGSTTVSTSTHAFEVTYNSCSTPAPSGKLVYAYYTNWSPYARNFFPTDVSFNTVDLTLYAFEQLGACAGRDGVPSHDCPGATQDNLLHSTDTWADYGLKMPDGTVGTMPDVLKLAHAAGHKVSLSIGGYSLSDQLTDLLNDTAIAGCTDNGVQIPASSPTARTAFINSMWLGPDPILKNYKFDGVDMDFEPNGNHWSSESLPSGACYQPVSDQIIQNYAQFLVDLKGALTSKQPGYDKLTIALTANPSDIARIADTKCDSGTVSCWVKIANTVDTINVMAYDYRGAFDAPGLTNFSAPLYADDQEPAGVPHRGQFNIDQTIQAYLKAGVDPKKLILGVPTYERLESGVNVNSPIPTAPGLYTVFTGAPNGEYGDNTGVFDYKCVMSFFGSKFNIAPLPAKICSPSTIPGVSDFVNNLYLRKNSSNQVVGVAAYTPTGHIFLSMDGVGDPTIDTLTPKIKYVTDNKLGGVMFWELAGDVSPTVNSQYSMIYQAHKQLNPTQADKK